MKNLLSNTWFQIILAGAVIGAALIVLDNQFHLWNKIKKDKGEYIGPVEGDKDKMYITTASYSETSFDFGKVKETDTVVHKIMVKNTGKEPLFIFKAIGSCECVRAFFSRDPIAPKAESEITVVFLAKGRKGKQQRSVMIDTNTEPAEMVIAVTGEVE
jgi:hypothetical protein